MSWSGVLIAARLMYAPVYEQHMPTQRVLIIFANVYRCM